MLRPNLSRWATGLIVCLVASYALIQKDSAAARVAVTVQISPLNSLTPVGSTRQFSAAVSGGISNAVTWSLVAPAGVNPANIGTISAAGLYSAPAAPLPNFAPVTVKATSVDDPSVSASTIVTVRNQIPWTTSVSPNSIPLGTFTLTVNGQPFCERSPSAMERRDFADGIYFGDAIARQHHYDTSRNVQCDGGESGAGRSFNACTAGDSGDGHHRELTPGAPVLPPNGTQQFAASIVNNANQAVTWRVNGVAPGNSTYGTITPSGLYTAPSAAPTGTIVVTATSQADGTTKGSAVVTVQDAQNIKFARFLDQVTFGVTPTELDYVKQIGIPAYLDEQFNMPESPWPTLSTVTRADAIDAFVNNQFSGKDQLRQRVIFALSEYIVIALNKNTNGDEVVPWLQLLSRNAFGNYRTLLKELTLDSCMAKFLDLANSGGSGAANENYPREIMQLFSIGLNRLKLDGSLQLDAQNLPIPTYTQTDVQQLALALTGWTYSNATGTAGPGGNYAYYPAPMIPMPGKHNQSQKIVGVR